MRFRRSRIACISAAVAAFMYGAPGVLAADLTWDSDPGTAGVQDGTGSWDTTTANWFDGVNNVTWSNSNPDSALLGNDTNTFSGVVSPYNVDLAAPITAQNITFGVAANGATYNISDFGGGSLTLAGNVTKDAGGGQIQFLLTNGLTLAAGNHVVALTDSPGDVAEMSINGSIAGAGDLTVDNGALPSFGTLVLNADNTYTGVTTITKGRLVVTTSNGLGSTSAGTVIGPIGTLSIGGAGTTVTGGLTIAEPITIKRDTYTGGDFGNYPAAIIVNNNGPAQTHTLSGQLTVDSTDSRIRVNSNTLVISSNIAEGPDIAAGTGVLTLDGDFAGFVTLTGDNSAIGTGGIRLIGGVELNVSNDNNLGGASSTLTFLGSGTLHPVGGFMSNFGTHVINNTTFSGGFDVDSGQTFTIDQALGDSVNAVGTLGKRGVGTMNINSTVNLRGGQSFWDSGTVNVNSSVTLASLHLRSPIVNIGNGGSVTTTAGYNSFGQDSTGTNGGPDMATVNISGTGQLIQNDAADFNISDNANTTGTINIADSGVLTTHGITWLGKGAGATGTINQTGGTVNILRTGNFGLVLGDGRFNNGPTGFYGMSGTSVLNCSGEMYVGEGHTATAHGVGTFTMSGGTVNLSNWFVVGREGASGTVDISGGVFNHTGGNTSMGDSASNTVDSMTLRGTAQYLSTVGEFWDGNGTGTTATLVVKDSAVLTVTNWFAVGRGGAFGTLDISDNGSVTKSGSNNSYVGESNTNVTSTMTVRGSGSFTASTGEFWVGQGGGSGILNIQDNATFTVNNWLALGRANGNSIGVINLSGGTLTKQGSNFLAVGSGGNGTLNQTGGTLSSSGTRLAENSGGTMNLSGGTSTFTGEFSLGYVAGAVGTLNISNTANVTLPAVIFGVNSTTAGNGGVLNLNGGTLTGTSFTAGASATALRKFVFNGGTLKPASDQSSFIGAKVTSVVSSGGALIDSDNHVVTINSALTHDATLGGADGGLTKSGSGSVTLTGANTYTGPTNATGGTLIIANNLTTSSGVNVSGGATMQLPSNGTFTRVIKTGNVTVGSGMLDLIDNKLITTTAVGSATGGVYDGISGLIQSGRNGGGWGGNGIVTSQSTATTSNLTSLGVATAQQAKGLVNPTDTAVFNGQTVTGSNTLVMYTYGGDANLDGKINVDDYGHIDSSAPLGIAGWFNGDFNYDGKVNVDDYGIIDFNIGIQGGPFPTAAGAASSQGASLSGVSAVPEPASVSLLVATAAAAMNRRSRGRRCRRESAVN